MQGGDATRRNCAAVAGPTKAKERWKILIGKDATGPVVGADGTVYVGAGAAGLVAVKPTGKIAWKTRLQGAVLGAPAVLPDGTIVVGTTAKKVVAVSADGKRKPWTFDARQPVTCNLTVDHEGSVYATTKGANLVVLGANGKRRFVAKIGKCLYYCPAQPAVDASGRIFARGFVFDRAGKPLWQYKNGSGPVVADDGSLVLAAARTGVLWLDAATGKPRGTLKLKAEIGSVSQGASGTIYASSESSDASVHACTRTRTLRTYQANNWIRAQVLVDRAENLFFGCVGGMYAYAKKGTMLWSVPIRGDVRASPAIANDGTIYVTTSAGVLYAFW